LLFKRLLNFSKIPFKDKHQLFIPVPNNYLNYYWKIIQPSYTKVRFSFQIKMRLNGSKNKRKVSDSLAAGNLKNLI